MTPSTPPMTPEQLQSHLRTLNLRVGPETARYILTRLSGRRPFPVFATDARTGHPLHPNLHPADFAPSAQPSHF